MKKLPSVESTQVSTEFFQSIPNMRLIQKFYSTSKSRYAVTKSGKVYSILIKCPRSSLATGSEMTAQFKIDSQYYIVKLRTLLDQNFPEKKPFAPITMYSKNVLPNDFDQEELSKLKLGENIKVLKVNGQILSDSFITESGRIIQIKELIQSIMGKDLRVRLSDLHGRVHNFAVAKIVYYTFNGIDLAHNGHLKFKDGNSKNLNLDNLEDNNSILQSIPHTQDSPKVKLSDPESDPNTYKEETDELDNEDPEKEEILESEYDLADPIRDNWTNSVRRYPVGSDTAAEDLIELVKSDSAKVIDIVGFTNMIIARNGKLFSVRELIPEEDVEDGTLFFNTMGKNITIKFLVYNAFVQKIVGKFQILQKDKNPRNCNADNLYIENSIKVDNPPEQSQESAKTLKNIFQQLVQYIQDTCGETPKPKKSRHHRR